MAQFDDEIEIDDDFVHDDYFFGDEEYFFGGGAAALGFAGEEAGVPAGTTGDITAADVAAGVDPQGIPWPLLSFTREKLREMKVRNYVNYQNLSYSRDGLDEMCKRVKKGSKFYDFRYNARSFKSTIVHFQLRNLIWATSKHDVYITQNFSIRHWSSLAQNSTEVLDVAGHIEPTKRHCVLPVEPVASVQITTMAVKDDLLVVGGFHGELICKLLDRQGVAFSTRISNDENAITNSIQICDKFGSTKLLIASNDCSVRLLDMERFSLLKHETFPWSVNSASISPDGHLLAVLGDDVDGLIVDPQSGKPIATLNGHMDYSFACAWHPDGRILATGNQDTTCRLWDVRKLSNSVAILKGRMGAIRGVKFSPDGRFLAIAEPADFVHIFDADAGYDRAQEIDLFGEIAGLSFSPDDEALFVGVADHNYGGMIEFGRRRAYHYLDSFV